MDESKLVKMALSVLRSKSHRWPWALKQLKKQEYLMRVSWEGDKYARWYPIPDTVIINDFGLPESSEYNFTMDDFDADDWILQSDWEELFGGDNEE